jgi:hypothetical protein
MLRTIVLAGLAAPFAALAVPLMVSVAIPMAAAGIATPAHAQIGTIFNDAPRPPANVSRGNQPPPTDSDEEEVPDLPPGRLLPPPNRPMVGRSAMPGPVESQPLAPVPGTSTVPQNVRPNIAVTPPQPGQRPLKEVPQPPAGLQPGDEIVTEPPPEKIVNKEASFTGLDKITGRTINFDEKIGETVQFGALRVKTDACYTRPATEAANTDAFVEVDEITLQGEVKRIFSGWMFAASPGLHAVEHPVYDIWLTDCKDPEATVVSAAPEAAKPAPAPAPVTQRRPAPRPAAPRPPPVLPQRQTQQQLPPSPPPPQPHQQQGGGLFGIFR